MDSVADFFDYDNGSCGDKFFELDSTAPPFLTITRNAEDTGIHIFYDSSKSSDSDVGVDYSVKYKVRFIEYTGVYDYYF